MRNPFDKKSGKEEQVQVRPADNLEDGMKIFGVELHHAVLIPGTRVSMDYTLNATKQPGLELSLVGNCLKASIQGKSALIPLSNVKVILLAD